MGAVPFGPVFRLAENLRPIRMRCLLILLCLLSAPIAWAQPLGGGMDSIEWLVADSDLVVVGSVTALERIRQESSAFTTTYLATVQIQETLKGPRARQVRIVCKSIDGGCREAPRARGMGKLARWAANGARLIFFLKESWKLAAPGSFHPDHSKPSWIFTRERYAPRQLHDENSIRELDAGADVQAFSHELKPLSKSEELLQAARSAARHRARPGAPVALTLDATWLAHELRSAGRRLDTRPYNGNFYITLLLDDRLQRTARAWARSSEKNLRLAAVEVLACFKSEENARILRALADDPATWSTHRADHEKPQPVRWISLAASQALANWGM